MIATDSLGSVPGASAKAWPPSGTAKSARFLPDDGSRVVTSASFSEREDRWADFDCLPAALHEPGRPRARYVVCPSRCFPQHPEARTQLGAGLRW